MSKESHPKPRRMNAVLDGIIDGVVTLNRQQCGSCGHYTRCIFVVKVEMPPGVELAWTKLAARGPDGSPLMDGDQNTMHIEYIGIGCGCYARFHRQVVHIEWRRARDRGVAVHPPLKGTIGEPRPA